MKLTRLITTLAIAMLTLQGFAKEDDKKKEEKALCTLCKSTEHSTAAHYLSGSNGKAGAPNHCKHGVDLNKCPTCSSSGIKDAKPPMEGGKIAKPEQPKSK